MRAFECDICGKLFHNSEHELKTSKLYNIDKDTEFFNNFRIYKNVTGNTFKYEIADICPKCREDIYGHIHQIMVKNQVE